MISGVWLAILLTWDLGTRVNDATNCVTEMMTCTRQMTSNIESANYKSLLCGIMADYLDCIEYVCNASLTSCEVNRARSLIADMITEYGVKCAIYIPNYDEDCSQTSSATSLSSSSVGCVVVYICCVFLHLSQR